MKNILLLPFTLLLFLCLPFLCSATTVNEEIDRVSGEVAKLELGFNDYVLGKKLSADQQDVAEKNMVEKALTGTYKFKDGDVFVIASKETDTVIGLYQDYPDASMETLKSVIGGLMLQHGEPTAMAHNKMVYWTYNEKGKIEQDAFDIERVSGGVQSLVTVKFSSTEPIIEKVQKEGEEESKISAYVMITSDPLSKLILAKNSAEAKAEK